MAHYPAPDTRNYTFGCHRLLIGATDLGNIVNASASVNITDLSHFSARSGMDVEDANFIQRMTFNIEATLDEPNKDNMLLFFMASSGGAVGMSGNGSVAVTFEGIPVEGNSFSWAIPKAKVRPNGNFGFNSGDWSTFSLSIKVMYDSTAPGAPFGTLTHNGVT
jgi:hypothetical protein